MSGSSTAITYGQSLIASSLSGIVATDPISRTPIVGALAWNDGSTTFPSISDSNTTPYTYTFTATTYPDLYKTVSGITTVKVDKAVIIVSADNKTKIYGDDNPILTVSYSGFVNGQNESILSSKPVISTSADKYSPAGTYPITLSGGGTADNYTVTYVDGTLTIDKAILTVTADDVSKTYSDDNPILTVSYSGFVNGQNESVLITKPIANTNADKESPIGTYAITLSGGVADNYAFEYVDGTLTVTSDIHRLILLISLITAGVLAISAAAILIIRKKHKQT